MIEPMNAEPLPTNHAPADTPLTPEHARQRASIVMLVIGVTQLLPFVLAMLPLEMTAGLHERRAWLAALAMGGGIYVLTALPVRFNIRPLAWLALAAATGQAMVFIVLAVLMIVAAIGAGSSGSMTMGVLLFGSVASLHVFVARWIASALRSKTP